MMALLDRPLPGTTLVLYDYPPEATLRPLQGVSALRVVLDDGRMLSIEMVDDNEVALVVHQAGCGEAEIVWSEVLDA